ncbi:MAG: hypothetical protein A3G76_08625 [Acidobacteria bacterium RIFCSPLOWO2_12_FULL_65_11]|nr:MAG: hypothetical protein A3H95_09365 [Acidobacteria bacterium RIFCSPLOWO2_02_FULL_64_15]OFW33564.1 MAG: hypothetical protein A3G76_08625 [Acidobacteria bacterium RIFCSPLOWO2_12_FULL_65_11]
MTGLNWAWIAIALTLPTLLGGLVAYPLWRAAQPIFGNLAGTLVIFASAMGFIMREDVELKLLAQECLDQGLLCVPEPSAFARFAIYSFIALFEVVVLFSVSLKVEAHLRSRGYDPEWRR